MRLAILTPIFFSVDFSQPVRASVGPKQSGLPPAGQDNIVALRCSCRFYFNLNRKKEAVPSCSSSACPAACTQCHGTGQGHHFLAKIPHFQVKLIYFHLQLFNYHRFIVLARPLFIQDQVEQDVL